MKIVEMTIAMHPPIYYPSFHSWAISKAAYDDIAVKTKAALRNIDKQAADAKIEVTRIIRASVGCVLCGSKPLALERGRCEDCGSYQYCCPYCGSFSCDGKK